MTRLFPRSALLAACAAALLCAYVVPSSAQVPTNYLFTTIDGPGLNGGGTTINGISNNGTVVGLSSDNAGTPTLFTNFLRSPNGTFSILNMGLPLAMANGVNVGGDVVGGNGDNALFLPHGGVVTNLPLVIPTSVAQTAFGINDNGLIVGQFLDSATTTTPGFEDNAGTFKTVLPPAQTVVNAQGINNSGLATGFYSADGVHQHPFVWNTTTNAMTFLPDPVVPNLVLTQFLGINDLNQIAGYYQDASGSQHGLFFDLATNSYSFLDDPLAASLGGVAITQITGINNARQISGFYIGADGVQRGFIGDPVPEPGAGALLVGLLGPAALLIRRRR